MENLHFHSFAMGILLLTLTHLVLFVPISMRAKAWGIATAFFSGLGDELSGWAVRFVHPEFAYLKITCFVLLQGSIACLIILVGYALLTSAPSAYTQGGGPPVRPVT